MPSGVGGNFLSLDTLRVSRNHISRLSPTLARLTRLRQLDLSRNHLRDVPRYIGKLHRLEVLNLRSNPLTTLSFSMTSMTKLRDLDLSNCRLETLPLTVTECESLRVLRVKSCRLIMLPEDPGTLVNLRLLDISNNQIQMLPASFGTLTELHFLKVEGNPITYPPSSVVAKGILRMLQWLRERSDTADLPSTPVPPSTPDISLTRPSFKVTANTSHPNSPGTSTLSTHTTRTRTTSVFGNAVALDGNETDVGSMRSDSLSGLSGAESAAEWELESSDAESVMGSLLTITSPNSSPTARSGRRHFGAKKPGDSSSEDDDESSDEDEEEEVSSDDDDARSVVMGGDSGKPDQEIESMDSHFDGEPVSLHEIVATPDEPLPEASAVHSTVILTSSTGVAGESVLVDVELRDSHGSPAVCGPNQLLFLRVVGSDNNFRDSPTWKTSSPSVLAGVFTPTTAGRHVIMAIICDTAASISEAGEGAVELVSGKVVVYGCVAAEVYPSATRVIGNPNVTVGAEATLHVSLSDRFGNSIPAEAAIQRMMVEISGGQSSEEDEEEIGREDDPLIPSSSTSELRSKAITAIISGALSRPEDEATVVVKTAAVVAPVSHFGSAKVYPNPVTLPPKLSASGSTHSVSVGLRGPEVDAEAGGSGDHSQPGAMSVAAETPRTQLSQAATELWTLPSNAMTATSALIGGFGSSSGRGALGADSPQLPRSSTAYLGKGISSALGLLIPDASPLSLAGFFAVAAAAKVGRDAGGMPRPDFSSLVGSSIQGTSGVFALARGLTSAFDISDIEAPLTASEATSHSSSLPPSTGPSASVSATSTLSFLGTTGDSSGPGTPRVGRPSLHPTNAFFAVPIFRKTPDSLAPATCLSPATSTSSSSAAPDEANGEDVATGGSDADEEETPAVSGAEGGPFDDAASEAAEESDVSTLSSVASVVSADEDSETIEVQVVKPASPSPSSSEVVVDGESECETPVQKLESSLSPLVCETEAESGFDGDAEATPAPSIAAATSTVGDSDLQEDQEPLEVVEMELPHSLAMRLPEGHVVLKPAILGVELPLSSVTVSVSVDPESMGWIISYPAPPTPGDWVLRLAVNGLLATEVPIVVDELYMGSTSDEESFSGDGEADVETEIALQIAVPPTPTSFPCIQRQGSTDSMHSLMSNGTPRTPVSASSSRRGATPRSGKKFTAAQLQMRVVTADARVKEAEDAAKAHKATAESATEAAEKWKLAAQKDRREGGKLKRALLSMENKVSAAQRREGESSMALRRAKTDAREANEEMAAMAAKMEALEAKLASLEG